ncbi:MAG TPA: tyrosine-type recombinase/integrase [Longimicrobiales bacterium]|nr:tyrosine-type recombinase/integrase [Longimicrobiales bacterium]
MAPFRRKDRPGYYIEPTIPGMGRIGRFSTGVRDRAIAGSMEAALHELALTGWQDLLEQLRDHRVTLTEVWQAKLRGRDALQQLRNRHHDPLLVEAVRAFAETVTDERVAAGGPMIERLAEQVCRSEAAAGRGKKQPELRLSWLTEPRNVTRLYAAAVAEGRRANTVRRTLHRFVSDLLSDRFRRGQMLAIMADVRIPGENDERVVYLQPHEALDALGAADAEFAPVLGLALTTGIDRGPMLSGRVVDYDEQQGLLAVRDFKTHARPRMLVLRGEPVLENSEYWLRFLVAGREPGAPLVPVTANVIRSRWEDIRSRIGRPEVRWKDLRACFATHYLLAGGGPKELQHVLGHAAMNMTMRYLRRLPAGNRAGLRDAAKGYGLPGGRTHLRLETGGAA